MERLHGFVQHYDWGSTSLLATLRGEPPSDGPEAELWYGAHRAGPSRLAGGRTLVEAIDDDPLGQLGSAIVEQFGPRLPFLLKLLAAERPLSIQAHPSAEQARAGFAAEEAAGIPRSDPMRSFRDPNDKPELIFALTSFEALVGFRSAERTRSFYEAIGFDRVIAVLGSDDPKTIVQILLGATGLDTIDVTEIVLSLVQQCEWYERSGADTWRAEAELVGRLAREYHADPGIAVASLLNLVALEPGEALYLDAGVLHAYVGGLAVEIMGNSDNVARGGLTSKNVDTATLLDILLPHPLEPEVLAAGPDGAVEAPAPEFALTALVDPDDRSVRGPAIVLAVDDTLNVTAPEGSIELAPTEACWVAADELVAVSGTGRSFLATAGATPTLVDG